MEGWLPELIIVDKEVVSWAVLQVVRQSLILYMAWPLSFWMFNI